MAILCKNLYQDTDSIKLIIFVYQLNCTINAMLGGESVCAKRELFLADSAVLVKKSGMDAHTVRFLEVNMVIRAAYVSDGDEVQIWGK